MLSRLYRLTAVAVTALGIVLFVAPAAAQDGQAPLVIYDHAGTNADREFKRNVGNGSGFVVKIENTCPEAFDYGVTAIPAATPRRPDTTEPIECEPGLSASIPIAHSEATGGYIIDIRRKDRNRVVKIKGGPVLNDVKVVISVTTRGWETDFSSGFTISNLTSPRFGLQTREVDGMEKSFVVEDRGAEDEVSLGAAAFVNVFRSEFPHLGLSFGLGISEETETTYYAGLSWRWGSRGSLTFGYAFGSVDQLPPGTDVSQPVDSNFLSSLDSKVDSDLFLSFTYSFLGGADRFKKPFEKVESKSTPTSGQTTGSQPPSRGAGTRTGGVPTPKNLTVEVEGTGARIGWGAVAGEVSYRVYRSSVSCEEGMERIAELSDGTGFLDEGLLAGQEYSYRVSALIGGKESLASDCLKAKVADE